MAAAAAEAIQAGVGDEPDGPERGAAEHAHPLHVVGVQAQLVGLLTVSVAAGAGLAGWSCLGPGPLSAVSVPVPVPDAPA